MIKISHAVVIILLLSTICPGKYNSLRIWLSNVPSTATDDLLRKAKRLHYNYVMAEFQPQTSAEEFRDMFKRVDSFGLRLIPMVQVADMHAENWWNFRYDGPVYKQGQNNNIDWNQVRPVIDNKPCWFKCPSLLEDKSPGGFDNCFRIFLQNLRDGFIQAKLSYPLEYIHLGHDELNVYNEETRQWDLLLINCGSALDRSYFEDTLGFDRIQQKTDMSTEIQHLLAAEIHRRVIQVRQTLNEGKTPFTKVIIYGDQWDPEHNGGYPKRVPVKVCFRADEQQGSNRDILPVHCDACTNCVEKRYDRTVILSPGILDLPGLTSAQKAEVRNNVIIQPWMYDEYWDLGGKKKYNATNTFYQLSTHGFSFCYVSSIAANDTNNISQIKRSFAMMHNYIQASRNFRSSCLGYVAAQWVEYQVSWSGGKPYKNDPWAMMDSLYVNNK